MCVYIYIYICVCVCVYICVYIYMYRERESFTLSLKDRKLIPVVFHNGSRCNYHFIIKELAKELECQF